MMIRSLKRGRIPSQRPPGIVLVEVNGFEPMAFPLVKRDALASQPAVLLPHRLLMVEVNGFEPMAFPLVKRDALASQPAVLLPHRLLMVEVNGFEPMASCVQGRRSPS